MSTRAQIGVYESDDSREPVAIIKRSGDGHPTGHNGVCPLLSAVVPAIVGRRGLYDAPHLAAHLLQALLQETDGVGQGVGYSLSSELDQDIRFFYAVAPAGMTVYDARELTHLPSVKKHEPLFFTAWVEPERVRALETEIRLLEDQLTAKKLEFAGMQRKQLRRTR